MQDRSSRKYDELLSKTLGQPAILFLAVSGLFIIFFWIWFIVIRTPMTDSEKDTIQARAMTEILSACNDALPDNEQNVHFRPQDVKKNVAPPIDGVSALVSTLEISRNDYSCRWDGINPARVFHNDSTKHQKAEP